MTSVVSLQGWAVVKIGLRSRSFMVGVIALLGRTEILLAQDSSPVPIRAEDLAIGGPAERYLKALSVLQRSRRTSWVMRGEYDVALRNQGDAGPWPIDTLPRRVSWRGGQVEAQLNGAFPIARDDGASWNGRGIGARVIPVLAGQWGVLRFRLAPELWWTENRPFGLAPSSPTPYSDVAKGNSIDLPQRFGPTPLGRTDPGESHVAIQWRGMRLAATTGALRTGTGSEQSILLQGGQGGFPRLEAGIPGGLQTPIGRFSGALGWGRLSQTAWAADRRVGARLGSYVVAAWTPTGDRMDLGLARFYHQDWAGIRAKELLVPFGSLFRDDQTLGLDVADNQLAVLFFRVRAPEAGVEVFGEFGRNDRSTDTRDLLVELDHSAAWLFGVQRVWRASHGSLRSVTLSAASGRIPALARFRFQESFYAHDPLTQGHTMRGQLLGTGLLERDGGAELRMDWFEGRGAGAAVLTSRAMANQRGEAVDPAARRHEWALWWERHHWLTSGRWMLRVGGIADLGRGPASRDAYAMHVGSSYTWVR